MKELKELIVYLFYGFYQIDYVLGIRELRSYNTRTGGALLLVTLFLYLFRFYLQLFWCYHAYLILVELLAPFLLQFPPLLELLLYCGLVLTYWMRSSIRMSSRN